MDYFGAAFFPFGRFTCMAGSWGGVGPDATMSMWSLVMLMEWPWVVFISRKVVAKSSSMVCQPWNSAMTILPGSLADWT